MRCGLYGKLPIKRDFIAEAVPRGFLPSFEPWLQGAVGQSRMMLGQRWQDIYLKAPIWRFWLGANYCGRSVAGALMPSIDGVGRYFPLVVMALADEGRAIEPPTVDPQEDWFLAVETFLLGALEEDRPFEAIAEELAALPPPADVAARAAASSLVSLADGTLVGQGADGDVGGVLATLRDADAEQIAATGTVWWTIGGEDIQPLAVACRRLPDPSLFAGFLTGRFGG